MVFSPFIKVAIWVCSTVFISSLFWAICVPCWRSTSHIYVQCVYQGTEHKQLFLVFHTNESAINREKIDPQKWFLFDLTIFFFSFFLFCTAYYVSLQIETAAILRRHHIIKKKIRRTQNIIRTEKVIIIMKGFMHCELWYSATKDFFPFSTIFNGFVMLFRHWSTLWAKLSEIHKSINHNKNFSHLSYDVDFK